MARGPSLDDVQIASPCSERWDRMRGDSAVRHCDSCHMNVYNLSNMTREEALAVLARHEPRMCVRFYRRRDGTVLTRDCPVGVSRLRHAARRSWARLAAAISVVIGALLSLKALTRRTDAATRAPAPIAAAAATAQALAQPQVATQLQKFAPEVDAPPGTPAVNLKALKLPYTPPQKVGLNPKPVGLQSVQPPAPGTVRVPNEGWNTGGAPPMASSDFFAAPNRVRIKSMK
jgi:hypothetical protein